MRKQLAKKQASGGSEPVRLKGLRGFEPRVECVRISTDGRYAVFGCTWLKPDPDLRRGSLLKPRLHVLDLERGEEAWQAEVHIFGTQCLGCLPGARQFVSWDYELSETEDWIELLLWDLESGQVLRRSEPGWKVEPGIPAIQQVLVFSPDASTLFGGAYLYDASRWPPVRTRKLGYEPFLRSASFSPDGRLLATACLERDLAVLELYGGETVSLRRLPEGHKDGVLDVAFLPDGLRLVLASADRTMVLWDLETGKALCRYRGHKRGVNTVAISPDGRLAASGGEDRTVRLWELDSGRELAVWTGHTNEVLQVAFSPDGRRVISAGADRTARRWTMP
jgi:WD40 domain-containing protein